MNVREAAKRLKLSPQQVRWLIRGGRVKAQRTKSRHNQYGYEYNVDARSVEKYGRSDHRPGRKPALSR